MLLATSKNRVSLVSKSNSRPVTRYLSSKPTILEKLLRECVTLEVVLERNTEPHIMALLLPDYWADFIRSGPIEDVKPLGVGKP